ncbi:uridine kinase [Waddlia chondrophila]|uniref:Uridine kinase n=1 Tax=Waddlia chondrophila (strain ATCC VR-1470 / WSU 86-1044) TaxID=716544 RepID=D6YV54_WADCW|nr:uridine kinase [Waddlia chondrophila]ADI38015.1 Uridine kinase [Waddlia chondrophila WSU 86-1044]
MKKFWICALLLLVSQLQVLDAVLVGIAGGTGSGKTTLATKLSLYFGTEAVLISQDCYYKDLSHLSTEERAFVNFDHPDSLDLELMLEHLSALKQGNSVVIPSYDFTTHTRVDQVKIVDPASLIIVEGILLLAVPEIRELFDLKIFIDTDDDIRILRRLERDLLERGRNFDSVKNQYLSTVKPMHHQFVEPSKNQADVVIWGTNENFDVATGLISGYLKKL